MKTKKVRQENSHDTIDAVITWVDGNDPKHKAKIKQYLKPEDLLSGTATPTYFAEVGELEYCVASILKYTPWIRNIFIVSDNQKPKFWNKIANLPIADKIKIIDHKEIFSGYEYALPTFNSRSIVTMLWRIPGLAEQFIYFNDDFVFLRPLNPEDFFFQGKLVVNGKWKIQYDRRIDKKILKFLGLKHRNKERLARPGYEKGQSDAAKIVGFNYKYFSVSHYPHPQKKSFFEIFFTSNPELLKKNISYRTRSGNQFLAESLNLHLAFRHSAVNVKNHPMAVMIKIPTISMLNLKFKLSLCRNIKKSKFLCVQNLDRANDRKMKPIIKFLDERVGRITQSVS